MPLNDKCGRPHAQHQTVTPSVERQGGFFHHVAGGGSTRGCKAACNPFPEVIPGHVVTADDDHAIHTVGVQPILGHAERCCG